MVTGTGPSGRIVRRDAEEAIAVADRSASETAAASEGVQPQPASEGSGAPHSRVRKAIAARLSASKREVPHFYLKRTVEVDALLKLRAQINEAGGTKVSVNDLLVKAVAVAHTAEPAANVVWTDEEMLSFDTVDVAVAVASDRGLVTPVVRDVESRSIGAVSKEVKRLAVAANQGSLKQHELEGGTITVTNLGMFGVDEFAAIINPPQSMILAVGAVRDSPVVREGEVVVRSTLGLVLSVDHRAIDGALAARWLDAYATALASPLGLLL